MEVSCAVWFAGGAGGFTATAFFEHAAVNKSTAVTENISALGRLERLRYPIPLNFRPFSPGCNPPNAVCRLKVGHPHVRIVFPQPEIPRAFLKPLGFVTTPLAMFPIGEIVTEDQNAFTSNSP